MNSNYSHVFWITGLAGAGKSTFSDALANHLRSSGQAVIQLDGDELRKTIAEDLGYTPQDRLKAAKRYSKLCKLIASQNVHVLCATISMFHEVHDWNRINIKNYHEIYIKVPLDELERRNQKKLYSNGTQTMGKDYAVQEPLNADLILMNDSESKDECLKRLIAYSDALLGGR